MKVRVYTAGDEVRLLLNGKEIGTKPVSAATELKAEFDVPYAAGELKAIALVERQTDRRAGLQDRRPAGAAAADGRSRTRFAGTGTTSRT